jgi:hypothetical protein
MRKPPAPVTAAGIIFTADAFGAMRGTLPNGVAVWACKRGRRFSYGTGAAMTSRERGQAETITAALHAAIAAAAQP